MHLGGTRFSLSHEAEEAGDEPIVITTDQYQRRLPFFGVEIA